MPAEVASKGRHQVGEGPSVRCSEGKATPRCLRRVTCVEVLVVRRVRLTDQSLGIKSSNNNNQGRDSIVPLLQSPAGTAMRAVQRHSAARNSMHPSARQFPLSGSMGNNRARRTFRVRTCNYTEHARRKTVTALDVVFTLKRRGRTLYGFGGKECQAH